MAAPLPFEPVTLTTADGLELEAQLAPAQDPGTAVAVICHPHPLYGGSMHNNVVDRLFAHLPAQGVTALRFNFRGAGRSQGEHGDGRTEPADVVAAIDGATARMPDVPVLLAGYSFGADVALAVDDPRIGGWLAVSPPLRIVDPTTMAAAGDPRPTVIVTGSADAFRSPADAGQVTEAWPTTEVRAVDGVDHFWMQGLDQVAAAADDLLARLVTP